MNEITGITTLFLSIAFSIVVGLLTNLLTTPVQNWVNRISVSTRGKTLFRLKQDYGRIKRWFDNPSLLVIDIAPLAVITVALILLLLFLFVSISGVNLALALSAIPLPETAYNQYLLILKIINIGIVIMGVVILVSLIRLGNYLIDIVRLRNFGKYEKTVLARIKDLEESTHIKEM
jgi:hypothetical protein